MQPLERSPAASYAPDISQRCRRGERCSQSCSMSASPAQAGVLVPRIRAPLTASIAPAIAVGRVAVSGRPSRELVGRGSGSRIVGCLLQSIQK
jgi:hypothetical protein